ncbi:MAG: acetyltransferase [Opitutaceae bacterium]
MQQSMDLACADLVPKVRLAIVGASSHGRVVADAVIRAGVHTLIGFIDSGKPVGAGWCGHEILGPMERVSGVRLEHKIEGCVIAIGDNEVRRRCMAAIRRDAPGLAFVTVIHPFADVAPDSEIGDGAVILAGAIIGAGAKVGGHCIINTGAQLDHESSMGDFSSLAPKVATGGNVKIGEGAAVCIGASISHGVTIGRETVIGGGAVVLDDIPDFSVAYGVPARVVRAREAGDRYL